MGRGRGGERGGGGGGGRGESRWEGRYTKGGRRRGVWMREKEEGGQGREDGWRREKEEGGQGKEDGWRRENGGERRMGGDGSWKGEGKIDDCRHYQL